MGHDISTTQRDIPAVRVGQVREIPPYLGLRTRCVSGVVFSKQGGFLFSSGADGTYRVNSVLPNRQSRTDTIVGEPVSIYAPVSDGALVASWRGGLHHWNPTTHVRTLIPVPGQVLAVAVAGDGERFAVLIDTPTMLPGDFSDRSLLIFRLTERILERTIPVEPGPILTPLCFSRGGQILNLAVDNTICRWQVATGEALTTLKPPSPRILGLMPGPDDHELIISDTSKSRIVDIRSGESRVFGSEVIGQPLRNSISENGRKMVTMTRDTNPIRLRLWLIDRDATPMTTSLPLPVDSRSIFAISPDGRCVAIADLTGEVSIWHLATHQELLKLGSTGTVMRLNFSADGRTLFTLIRGPNQSPAWLQAWGEFRRD